MKKIDYVSGIGFLKRKRDTGFVCLIILQLPITFIWLVVDTGEDVIPKKLSVDSWQVFWSKALMKHIFVAILLLILAGRTNAQSSYHVTVDGTDSGDGSIENPWNITTAFNRYNSTKPGAGDIVYIHGGTYTATLHIWFGGDIDSNVTITNWNDEVAIIDGNTDIDDAAVIYIQQEGGGYVTIDGLTITNSQPSRYTDTTGSFPAFPQNTAGIQSAADNFTIRNCIIHDNHGNGIGAFAGNAIIENNVIYYNGWDAPDRGHCYGIYSQNADPTMHTYIRNNIMFKNFGAGFHIYVTNGESISNIHVLDNVVFEEGYPAHTTGTNIFIGGLAPLDGIEVIGNHTYFDQEQLGLGIRVGYYEQANKNITISDNYSVGGNHPFSIRYCNNVGFSRNTVIGGDYVYAGLVDWFGAASDRDSYTVDFNLYYYKGTRNDFLMDTNWDGWTLDYGFDLSGNITYSAPSLNKSFIKSTADGKWANLVAYDWELSGHVAVDLSSIMSVGRKYYIYDVQNMEGDAVASGVYTGESVFVPTTSTSVTLVKGDDVTNQVVHTSQKYNVYIVKFKDTLFGDIDGNQLLDLKDIIAGLQVLSGGEPTTMRDPIYNSQVSLEEIIYDIRHLGE